MFTGWHFNVLLGVVAAGIVSATYVLIKKAKKKGSAFDPVTPITPEGKTSEKKKE